MPRDEIVGYLERLRGGLRAPVREGVDVTASNADATAASCSHVRRRRSRAGRVVVATGAYQRPHRPPGAETLPRDLIQIDADDYRNPERSRRRGARRRQRPDGLPDRGGAARGRPRGRPRLRPRAVGAAADRRAGHRLVARRDRLPRRAASTRCRRRRRGSFANVLATGRGGGHDLHLPDAPRRGRDAGRPLPRRRRTAPPASRPTSQRASRGATSATGSRGRRSSGSTASTGRASPSRSRSTPRRRRASTWRGFGAVDLHRPASGPTTPPGCRGRTRSTRSASRCTTTGASTAVPGLYFSASTSCASGSRRS